MRGIGYCLLSTANVVTKVAINVLRTSRKASVNVSPTLTENGFYYTRHHNFYVLVRLNQEG